MTATKTKAAKTTKVAKPAKAEAGLTVRKADTLKVLSKGKELSHEAIAKATGRAKGNMLRELTEEGLVKTLKHEGERGFVYAITPNGKKALAKA